MALFEVGVVLAIVLLLAAVLLPALSRAERKTSRIGCINNLMQVDIAYRVWEGDNGDIFPMGISVATGGSREMAQTGNVVLNFQVMSNELGTPKILCCPNDTNRTPSLDFPSLANSNVSYFVAVDTTNALNPRALLSGDSNFEIKGVPMKSGLLSVWTNDPVTWSAARHVHDGNLGLADGSAQAVTSAQLPNIFEDTGVETNRLAIP
jgi:hypothetical protein